MSNPTSTNNRDRSIDWKVAGALLASAATAIAALAGLVRLVMWLLHPGVS